MAKFTNYIFIISGSLLLFYIFGMLPPESLTSQLFSLILNPTNITNSDFTNITITGGLSILTALTLGAGNYFRITNFKADFIVFASVIPILYSYGRDLLLIYNIIANSSQAIAILIFSPLLLVYVLTVIEWWRGINA